ncbi:hypothetical protein QR680_017881 [Steinernema hermaphroditum]|uniref:Nuclear receptor domain-containing protein n=1 Tax=Steinernema hermaphroditum TaxID=289476 RepID=A0AA39HH44_9BILA|nr:hypothetical protein QR680_017881 [Steinernema hermaphroditum]
MRPEAVNSSFHKHNPRSILLSNQAPFEIDLARLTDVEGRINKLLFSSYFPYSRTNTVRDYLTDKSDLIFVDTYEPVTHWKKPPPGMVYTENSTKEGYKMWGFAKVVLMIEFYKTFDFFRNLSESDQLALARATIVSAAMFLKACNSYFRGNRERLIDPDGTVPYQGLLADSPMVSKVRHSHVLSACVKNKITPEKAALLKTIIALNSAAPNLSEGAREVIEEERLKYVKALMKIVQLESDSVEWLPRFQRLYDMIHLNMTDTQNMMHFFMIEILPLLPKGLFTERIWKSPPTEAGTPVLWDVPMDVAAAPSKTEAPTICLICGRAAHCCHYGVPSCNGCKTFFRRAVQSKRILRCPYGGDCDFKHHPCRSCRFEKCVQLGMDPKVVNTRSYLREPPSSPEYITHLPLLRKEPTVTEKSVEHLVLIELKLRRLRHSSLGCYGPSTSLNEVLNKASILVNCNDVDSIEEEKKVEREEMWSCMDAIVSIEFLKTLRIFSRLTEKDRIALAKGTVIQLCQFHAVHESYLSRLTLSSPSDITKMKKIIVLKTLIALNSSAPELSTEAQDLIDDERVFYLKALMHIVRSEDDSSDWITRLQLLYDIVNKNVVSSHYVAKLFSGKFRSLLVENVEIPKIWLDLFFESSDQ